jgi:hypothetical protein
MIRTSVIGVAFLGIALFAAPAMAAQEQPTAQDIKEMIQGAMDAALAEMLKAGPQETGWNKGGSDVRAAAAAKPGGLTGNYLVTVDKDGEAAVTIFTTAPAAQFVPQDWKRISRIGDIDTAPTGSTLEFGNMDGPYYFVGRMAPKRVGDVICSSAPIGAELYQAPGGAGTDVMPPEVIEFMFKSVTEMISKFTVCERFDAKGADYSIRYYFEDGRTIPAMDAQNDRISIVPARPVAELLKPKA